MKLKTSILSAVSALSLVTIGATTISSFSNNSENNSRLELSNPAQQEKFSAQKAEQNVYWYDGKDDFKVQNFFTNDNNVEKYFYWEVNLGKKDILNGYNQWAGLDGNNNSETWTSWGNDRYTGTAWKNVNQSTILHVDLNQWGSVDNSAIYNNSKIQLLFREDKQGAAYFRTEQSVGVSSFKRSSNYYLSVFGYQKGSTAWSFSGGQIFMNLGNGVKFVN